MYNTGTCFIYILLLYLITLSHCLKCQDNEIENCINCGTGENSNKCSVCEDKYFLALDGDVCIKCDDSYNGMEGCSGTCTLMKEISNVKCQEGYCKPGYYEITPGFCSICSLSIPQCQECQFLNGKLECVKCNDYYFPNEQGICEISEDNKCKKYSNKNFCLECDQGFTLYPDGKCYNNIENCKIGIYSLEKNIPICKVCDIEYYVKSDGTCQKCTSDYLLVICEECHEEDGNILCDKGRVNAGCSYFSSQIGSCKRCSFEDSHVICKDCKKNNYDKLYIDSYGKCKTCISDSERGYCLVCSDDNTSPCDSCYKGRALINDECISCSDLFGYQCTNCTEKQCLECQSRYGLLNEESCSDCTSLFGEGCLGCGLSPYDLKPYCFGCDYDYLLGTDGKCKKCDISGCKRCGELGPKGFICDLCDYSYKLEDGKCIKNCGTNQVLGSDGECKLCYSDDINLSNCQSCKKDNNKYICIECFNDYNLLNGNCIQIDDEEIKMCSEIQNIASEETPILSCINCPENSDYIPIIKENGAKICVKKNEFQDLTNCESGVKSSEGENNYICNNCSINSELVYNDTLGKNICKCLDGYFYDDINTKMCAKCSELNYGCLKCQVSRNIYSFNYQINCEICDKNYVKDKYGHCSYCGYLCSECGYDENEHLICLKYQEPYFLSNSSEIKKCSDYFTNCVACSYINDEKTELKCDKCLDNYYLNKNNECVECYENINVYSGCLICRDVEEIVNNNICDKCKLNYFLTEEKNCEFCLLEKYGGDNCQECDYINKEGEEKRIGCIKCINSDDILLNGKCYGSIDNCTQYETYLNDKNEIKIRCIECANNYELNIFNRCKKIEVKILNCLKTNEDINNPKCLECSKGYELIGDECIVILALADEEIKGCEEYDSQYGYKYCIQCNDNYFIRMGNCIEKYNSDYIGCSSYEFKNGLFECLSILNEQVVSGHSIYKPKALSECSKIINIGADTRPIYSCGQCGSTMYEDENGIKICKNTGIFNCLEGKVNTSYYNNIYTCTKCKEHYFLSYNEYYEKKICKNIYDEEKKSDKTIENYEFDIGISAVNGKCNNGYFTRNKKVCIKCDDNNSGMIGCGGNCDFKINRELQLKCESNGCKEGYFEIIPGKCELCENIIPGCNKCKYIENNEKKYGSIEPIRKRELICDDNCEREDVIKVDNICYKCKDLIRNCEECILDSNIVKCKKAKKGYYIDKNGWVFKCEDNCDECEFVEEGGKELVKCLKITNSHNFINSEGKVKSCNDYYEGIPYCSSCSVKNNILECSYCSTQFLPVNGKCYSCEEVFDNKGCNSCWKYDNNLYCYGCKYNYTFISNLGKCIPKNEEIKGCYKVDLISISNDYFFNCTACDSSYLKAKDLKNRTKCYYRYDYNSFDNCRILRNIGSFQNPILSCEECSDFYTIIVDENKIQNCQYSTENLTGCRKAVKLKIFDEIRNVYVDDYNCTECFNYYELEYNEIKNISKCKASECLARNCAVCKDNNLYKCQECKSGYVFSKLYECIIKPTIIPNIYFKDIYRFALNGNDIINGEDIYGPIYTIRGLTQEDIVEMHSFLVASIFRLEHGGRNLEETKKLKSYCKYIESIKSSQTSLQLVDYKCIVDSENQDLYNYKLIQIDGSQFLDSDNLNAFDLENLVSNVDDISKYYSSYTSSDLDKYIFFSINDNINNILETNSTDNFNFTIKGKTDKEVFDNIVGELKIYNKNDMKANCNINAKNKNDASLNCEINLKSLTNKNVDETLTFKDDEILSDSHNVLLSGINKIKIIKLKLNEELASDKTDEEEGENKKTNLPLVIGLSLGLGIPILGIIIFLVIYFSKRKKNKINKDGDVKIYNKKDHISSHTERSNGSL